MSIICAATASIGKAESVSKLCPNSSVLLIVKGKAESVSVANPIA